MCGFVGFIGPKNDQALKAMSNQIQHRGPDSDGFQSLYDNTVHFAHRRLSIVDLSAAGHQPMTSRCGRFTIIFNGEIYNHLELRNEIQTTWQGHSDTETIIEYISKFGFKNTLSKIKGMFALAVCDVKDGTLYLARDRAGEKPLYYGEQNSIFFFGSELKSFYPHPSFKKEIDLAAIPPYLKYGYIPSPLSIFKGISKLLPGEFLTYQLRNGKYRSESYWELKPTQENSNLDMESATKKLKELLLSSVKSQLMSDVPVGAFLSSGVDSSLVTGLMTEILKGPVRTFSIGFDNKEFNEANKAKAIAKHFGTQHKELYVGANDLLKKIGLLNKVFDEPFADSSQIPTMILCEFAKQDVTVCLTGDAGDELFGGYNRYTLAPQIQSYKKISHFMGNFLPLKTLQLANKFGPRKVRLDQLERMKSIFEGKTPEQLYSSLIAINPAAKKLLIQQQDMQENIRHIENLTLQESMMVADFHHYLPDDILVKVDRAAMSVSLETRAPFLDKDVIEYAFNLPIKFKINGNTKIILRKLLAEMMPTELLTPNKMGFSLPLKQWLRSELKQWGNEAIFNFNFSLFGINQTEVKKLWEQHQSEQADWSNTLWSLIILSEWSKENL